MKCKWWTPGVILALWSATVLGAAALEIPMRFERYGDAEATEFRPGGYRILSASTQPPEGAWKLPQQIPAGSMYAMVELGGVPRLMILERAKPEDGFYTRLRLDANGDSDVTNDPVLTVREDEEEDFVTNNRFSRVMFPPVDLILKSGSGTAPYRFRIYAHLRGELAETGPTAAQIENRDFAIYMVTACCYAGEFEHDGTRYRFVLNDMNGNGTFDDPYAVSAANGPGGDQIFLTEGEKLSHRDGVPLGKLLQLKNALFEVHIDAAASQMVLRPCARPLVSVTLPMPMQRLALSPAAEGTSIVMYRPGSTVRIPPGAYRVGAYTASKKDAEGDGWEIWALGSPEGTPFDACEGGTLAFGEPFATGVEVPEYSYEQFAKGEEKRARLIFAMKGAAGERVANLERTTGTATKTVLAGNSNRPKAPEYRILTSAGQLAAQGSFEYG